MYVYKYYLELGGTAFLRTVRNSTVLGNIPWYYYIPFTLLKHMIYSYTVSMLCYKLALRRSSKSFEGLKVNFEL